MGLKVDSVNNHIHDKIYAMAIRNSNSSVLGYWVQHKSPGGQKGILQSQGYSSTVSLPTGRLHQQLPLQRPLMRHKRALQCTSPSAFTRHSLSTPQAYFHQGVEEEPE